MSISDTVRIKKLEERVEKLEGLVLGVTAKNAPEPRPDASAKQSLAGQRGASRP